MFDKKSHCEYTSHNIPATPLNDAHFGRVFYFMGGYHFMGGIILANGIKYSKRPLSYIAQLQLLQSRGLHIKNEMVAEQFLANVSYYRFSAYCLPFETDRHQFKPDITFEDVVALYRYDQTLRHLIDHALEMIEIYLRTKITYTLTMTNGPFIHVIHEDNRYFFSQVRYDQWRRQIHAEIERSKESFILHYRNQYDDFPHLPLWMAVEVMSFGSLSKLFNNLTRAYQKQIGESLGFHESLLTSWLHSMTFVRNVCAHHARLWNREMAISMKYPRSAEWVGIGSKRVGSVLYIINLILKSMPGSHVFRRSWQDDINGLIDNSSHANFILKGMGFSLRHVLWQ